MNFIEKPYCKRCGHPFNHEFLFINERSFLCETCYTVRPLYDEARSVIAYNDLAKKLILRFKYGDATYLAPVFASWLHHLAPDIFSQADCLVSVPLHWTRLLQRRYNQSALICLYLTKLLHPYDIPYLPSLLKRKKRTQPQDRKTTKERHQNVKEAFEVPLYCENYLKEKTAILVDDVMTTGATLEECSKALRKAGCKKIFCLTIARTLKK